jgi:hypothetical protein
MKTPLFVYTLTLFLCICLSASAAFSSETSGKSGGLAITIEGPRAQFTAGTAFGVKAILTNTSKSIIYLNERFLVLKVPAQVEGPASTVEGHWWAYMPIADHGENDVFAHKASVALLPNSSVDAEWLVDPRYLNPKGQQIQTGAFYPSLSDAIKMTYTQFSTELHFLLFSPGKYKLTVSANYWDKLPINLENIPKSVIESLDVDVAAPQSVILFGAALGGLIAFVLLPQSRPTLIMPTWQVHNYVRWSWVILKTISGAVTAMLMSAMVTILLARVAESQFLIRITVSDVWGAMAIGFIANYLGVEILNRIIKKPPLKNASKDDKIKKDGEKS